VSTTSSRPSHSRGRSVIREWQILRSIEGRAGKTLAELAALHGVHQRTIRRDIQVLEAAGFPVVDEWTESGRRWRVVVDWRKEVA